MGYAEFPHMNYEDTDFHELILMVKECRNNYKGTLNSITALTKRLDDYEKNVQSQLDAKVQQSMNTFQGTVLQAMDSRFNTINQNLANQIAQIQQQNTQWQSQQNNTYQSFTNQVNNTLSEYNNSNIQFQGRINKAINNINDSITEMNKNYIKFYNELTQDIDEKLDLFEKQVESILDSFKESLPLNLESILWLWNYAVDARSYNALEWYNDITTCEQWNESNITCAQWHTNSKEIFKWYSNMERLISPVSGDVVSPQRAIIELAEKLKINAITAGEYDALKLTAIEFDEMFMKTGNYDWLGNILLDRVERLNICSTVEQKGE